MIPRWSRRSVLGGLGALGLVGCSTTAGEAPTFDLGSSDRLSILTWPDYIDPPGEAGNGTIADASAALGLQISYDTRYEDNYTGYELLASTLNGGAGSFDIATPTNWRAAEMIGRAEVQPLPIEIIPNHTNLDPAYMTNGWDRGSRYQMPWQAGMTGIAYDPARTGRELNSVADLFDPAFKGRVGIIGEMREAVGLAMLANGDNPSRATEATAYAGLKRIEDAVTSGHVGAVTFEDFAPKLASGELWVAMAWSGDTSLLRSDRPDITFTIPAEGAIQWFDTMVIPQNSQNLAAAGAFMNYVYDPENAANITAYVNYVSPVLGVQEVLASRDAASRAIARDPLVFPDAGTKARLFTWGGLSTEIETRLDDDFAAVVGI
jgi:spermidine/putrescine transport system substrate-binding protein